MISEQYNGSLSGGKKISCKEMPGEKIYLLAFDAGKKSHTVTRRGKKLFLQRFGKKKFSPKPNHPNLSQKSNCRPLSKARA